MEPIEQEIIDRRKLMDRWKADMRVLEAEKAGASERQQLELDVEIARLGYKITCGEFALRELQEIIAERNAPRPERPPLPQARQLGVVERQRLEQETRARLIREMGLSSDVEIHVNVGRTTGPDGQPQISIVIRGRGKGGEEDA